MQAPFSCHSEGAERPKNLFAFQTARILRCAQNDNGGKNVKVCVCRLFLLDKILLRR